MDERIRKLIQAASARSAGETADLAASLARRAGPAGGDRTDPVAREWVRHWLPVPMPVAAVDCGCRTGRCGWCN